ncbi:MAG: hypothetical protein GF331_25305 [Chitinivibrionales bacterium]|nr:hypothetical protein [Chitinivibrionales bacterium]
MFPIPVPNQFSIVAHRGASGYAPENTIAAFELARRMGVNEIELDTWLSADGEVVICHDDSLERFGYPDISISQTAVPELKQLDMGAHFSPFLYGGQRLVTLVELCELFGAEITYHVELKGTDLALAAEVNKLIADFGLVDHSIVTSFVPEMLARMKDLNADLRLGWLVDSLSEQTIGMSRELDLFQLNPRACTVSKDSVRAAHAAVAEVQAWELLGSPSRVRELVLQAIEAGCDGVTINWPDWLAHQDV